MKIERRNPGAFQFIEEKFGTEVEEPFTRAGLLEHILAAIAVLRPDRQERSDIMSALVSPRGMRPSD